MFIFSGLLVCARSAYTKVEHVFSEVLQLPLLHFISISNILFCHMFLIRLFLAGFETSVEF